MSNTISPLCAIFYVYIHIDPRTNEVKYVGKGHGKRAWELKNRRNYHRNWIKELENQGISPIVEIIKRQLTEKEAFGEEIAFIKLYKESGYELCNLTNGGDGTSGYKWSEALREKMQQIQTSEEYRTKLSNARKRREFSLEWRQKISKAAMNRSDAHKSKLYESRRKPFSEARSLSQSAKRFKKKETCSLTREESIKQINSSESQRKFRCKQTGEIFEYLFEVRNKYGIPTSNLHHVLNGKRKAVGGLSFEYIE